MANETAFSYQAPDRLVYNLLTGGQERLGLLPLVEQYYRSQIEGLGGADTSPFTYTGERIAGFSPREELAMQLSDQGLGAFQPYFSRASGLTEEALATLAGGTSEAKSQLLRALQQGEDYTRAGLDTGVDFTTDAIRKASEAEGTELTGLREAEAAARRAEGLQNPFIEEALQKARASTAGFDTADIDRFMDPYEEKVVQQTIKDLEKAAAQRDIASDAAEVSTGAFGGSRSRLGAQERQIAEQRGLFDAIAGIRSRGFEGARGTALQEFARQRAAEAGAGSQIAGLGAQRAGAATGLASLLSGLAGQTGAAQRGTAGALQSGGQQLFSMGTGAGQQLGQAGVQAAQQLSGLAGQLAGGQQQGAQAMSGYAATLPQLQQQDVSNLFNVGAMNRARNQAQLDLNYQNFVGQYNLPQQLMSGFANFLTGAGPLAGGTGYSGTAQMTPFGQTGYAGYGNKGGQSDKLKPISPEKQKGLAALSKKAPDAVRQMGFNPVKAQRGGLASRFPMSSRKLGTA